MSANSGSIFPKCVHCSNKPTSAPLTTVLALGAETEDGMIEMRAADQYGVAVSGPVAEDWDEATRLLGDGIQGDDAVVWVDSDDPVSILVDLGEVWAAERKRERMAAAAAYVAIQYAADQGVSEVEIAKRLGVDRMTVRRALGKR